MSELQLSGKFTSKRLGVAAASILTRRDRATVTGIIPTGVCLDPTAGSRNEYKAVTDPQWRWRIATWAGQRVCGSPETVVVTDLSALIQARPDCALWMFDRACEQLTALHSVYHRTIAKPMRPMSLIGPLSVLQETQAAIGLANSDNVLRRDIPRAVVVRAQENTQLTAPFLEHLAWTSAVMLNDEEFARPPESAAIESQL